MIFSTIFCSINFVQCGAKKSWLGRFVKDQSDMPGSKYSANADGVISESAIVESLRTSPEGVNTTLATLSLSTSSSAPAINHCKYKVGPSPIANGQIRKRTKIMDEDALDSKKNKLIDAANTKTTTDIVEVGIESPYKTNQSTPDNFSQPTIIDTIIIEDDSEDTNAQHNCNTNKPPDTLSGPTDPETSILKALLTGKNQSPLTPETSRMETDAASHVLRVQNQAATAKKKSADKCLNLVRPKKHAYAKPTQRRRANKQDIMGMLTVYLLKLNRKSFTDRNENGETVVLSLKQALENEVEFLRNYIKEKEDIIKRKGREFAEKTKKIIGERQELITSLCYTLDAYTAANLIRKMAESKFDESTKPYEEIYDSHRKRCSILKDARENLRHDINHHSTCIKTANEFILTRLHILKIYSKLKSTV